MNFLDNTGSTILCLLALTLVGSASVAQVPPSIGGLFLAVDNSDDPLRIIEFRSREEVFKGPYIIVHNFSNKQIAGFRLAAAISAPGECVSEHDHDRHYSDRGFDHSAVSAGHSAQVYWNQLSPQGLVWGARDVTSGYAQFQVSVSEVKFADGTTWRRADPDDALLSTDELNKLAPESCEPWKQMHKALAEVTEVWSRKDAQPGYPVAVPTDGRVGFSFSCRIVGHAAICPTGYGGK